MSQGLLFTENVGATAGEGGDGCPDGPDGVEYQIGAGALHFKSTTPANQLRVPNLAREGETIKIIVTGTPGHVAWLLESDELQTRFLGANVGNLLLQSPLGVAMLGPIPSSGTLKVVTTAPSLPSGVESQRRFHQVMLTTGSGRYLTNPSGMVVVDSAF